MKEMKKGEVSTVYVISIVLGIAALVIVLLFWKSFSDLDYTSNEICKLSVVARATLPVSAQGYSPLKCTTGKICITDKTFGANCPQFLGEEDVQYVRLSGNRDNKANQIERLYVETMYSCWDMMGQGKLDIFKGSDDNLVVNWLEQLFTDSEIKPVCIICSRVALADDLLEKGGEGEKILALVDVNDYMENNGPANSDMTWLQLFTNREVRSYPAEFDESLSKTGEGTSEIAFVFMQILVSGDAWEEAGEKAEFAGIVVAGSALTRIGNPGDIIKTVAGGLIAAGVSGGLTYFNVKSSQANAIYQCSEYESSVDDGKPISRRGCSVVKAFDYRDVSKINDFCSRLEGSP